MLYPDAGPSWLVFFAECLKIITDSDLQIKNYKIEVQLKPKLHQVWRIALYFGNYKLQLSVFLKTVWVFWPERVVPPRGNSLWTVLLLPLCDQIACYVPTEKPMSIRPINSQCSRQQELASGSDAQRVPWNSGPKGLSTGLFAFPSPHPAPPKACSQARGEDKGDREGIPHKHPIP